MPSTFTSKLSACFILTVAALWIAFPAAGAPSIQKAFSQLKEVENSTFGATRHKQASAIRQAYQRLFSSHMDAGNLRNLNDVDLAILFRAINMTAFYNAGLGDEYVAFATIVLRKLEDRDAITSQHYDPAPVSRTPR